MNQASIMKLKKIFLHLFIHLLVPLNTDVCFKKRDFFVTNNNYLQSACLIAQNLSYSQVEMICQANGMNLFDISSEDLKTALIEYATEIYEYDSWMDMYVKGRDLKYCQHIRQRFNTSDFETFFGLCNEELISFCGYQSLNPVEFVYTEIKKNSKSKFKLQDS
jgi:hypothetical protein